MAGPLQRIRESRWGREISPYSGCTREESCVELGGSKPRPGLNLQQRKPRTPGCCCWLPSSWGLLYSLLAWNSTTDILWAPIHCRLQTLCANLYFPPKSCPSQFSPYLLLARPKPHVPSPCHLICQQILLALHSKAYLQYSKTDKIPHVSHSHQKCYHWNPIVKKQSENPNWRIFCKQQDK